jgi:DNA helicase-2/ATP-dependent DNA helicase PcrA
MAYIKLYINPKDELSLRRILNLYDGIGKKTIDSVISVFKTKNGDIIQTIDDYISTCRITKVKASLTKLVSIYQLWKTRKNNFVQMIDDMLLLSGYKQALENDNSPESKARLENIDEFKLVAVEFTKENPNGTMEDFIDKFSLSTSNDEQSDCDKISLMTLHSAKGLEYEVVFLTGCEECILPHVNSMINEDFVEEERRLFYVGITRAKRRLYLTNTKKRYTFGPEPQYNKVSRFIDEIPKEYILEL